MSDQWWWLSFCDSNGFAGVSVVRGQTVIDATRAAHALGCNPGGEVLGVPFPSSAGDPPAGYENRLLTEGEAKAMHALWMPDDPEVASLGSLAYGGDQRALDLIGEDAQS